MPMNCFVCGNVVGSSQRRTTGHRDTGMRLAGTDHGARGHEVGGHRDITAPDGGHEVGGHRDTGSRLAGTVMSRTVSIWWAGTVTRCLRA